MTPLCLLALLEAAASGTPAAPVPPSRALVVIALPANATHAMTLALNRLRGEAISVGFEVRLVDATTETLSLAELDGISVGLAPAAVVAISRPGADAQAQHTLDVWFLDRKSGKTSVAHLDAADVADAPDRADVVVAVRAVDFIRARMFDALAEQRAEPVPAPPSAPKDTPVRRYDVAAGLVVLGTPSGFAPSVVPQLAAGYRLTRWLRLGVTGFGFGTEPERNTAVGSVSVGQRFVGASLGLLGPEWHRVQPVLEVGGGEHWVVTRGEGTEQSIGLAQTRSSPAVAASAGFLVDLAANLALEVRGGTLWLHSRVDINAPADTTIGSVGRPLWFGGVALGARL